MKRLRNNVIRVGLEALYFSGAHHLLRPLLGSGLPEPHRLRAAPVAKVLKTKS